ncbi:hypothetical protein mEp010_79 [Escherichia phage mEp010]
MGILLVCVFIALVAMEVLLPIWAATWMMQDD